MTDELPKIEKGIPCPGKWERANSKTTLFDKMEVGDSFLIPCNGDTRTKERNKLYSHCFCFSKSHPPFKFLVRSVDGGIRCWRVV